MLNLALISSAGAYIDGTDPFFFFSSRRRHTRSYGDWSSDVCSSDLLAQTAPGFSPASTHLAPAHAQCARVLPATLRKFLVWCCCSSYLPTRLPREIEDQTLSHGRSEERRVGKECRSRWAQGDSTKKI